MKQIQNGKGDRMHYYCYYLLDTTIVRYCVTEDEE